MILLIDNYDSFVHNLARYFRLLGETTHVIRSDQLTIHDIVQLTPRAIVISPGPKSPAEAGVSLQVVRLLSGRFPILGVCLGHQAIGAAFGGDIVKQAPMHGAASVITHTAEGLFSGLPNPLEVGRYHSLVIDRRTIPDCLQITAETNDGIIMAVQHCTHRTYGVQFHPESVLSQTGLELLGNFLQLANNHPMT